MDEAPVADFCSLKTKDKSIVDELFFGIGEFQSVSVSHVIDVTDIVYPDDVAKLKPDEVRELSKRKGIIERIVDVDGVVRKSEAGFVV